MSTDLEFRQELLEIRLPAIKINSSQSSEDQNCTNQTSINDQDCHTPKSPQNMIPKILSCPPAPKKPTRLPSCKRKLSELQFFNMVSREEIESFFRIAEAKINGAKKRRCFE
ncbi:Hypothetical predicted protein [Olea europaea subsp. europaea]|uniref:Cyclin-dependent protein kinase inhibitor SMR1 n=1 Tax=Olea europaea subsp. europaea TaxID=158383 RepID=A0A8S0TX14_OLEEU|nr:Hypothetical predicted protein [Olea europaea subsp. europaea]